MSIVDWIEEYVPGAISTRQGKLLDIAYNIEYGAESSEQSSLNLLYLLGYSGQGQLRIFGPWNEKYHVVGGNDQIPARLAAALSGQVTLGSELTAIRRRSDDAYSLTFRNAGSTETVVADRVVLALPFAVLRESVDYSQAGSSRSSGRRSRRWAWARTPSCMSSSGAATGSRWGRTATRSPTRATRTRGT